MECNFQMERILASVYLEDVMPDHSHQVWQGKTLDGDAFWGVDNFCGLDTAHVIRYGRELTDLEWDGNEIFVSGEDAAEKAFAIYHSIKIQLQQRFSQTEFDLMVSVCTGEQAREGNGEQTREGNGEQTEEQMAERVAGQTAVIRFWAVRDGYHFIEGSRECLEQFREEAVLVDRINCIDIEREAEAFAKRYRNAVLEITKKPDEVEIVVKNDSGGEDIRVYFEDEITMVFGRFHSHYTYGEEEELKDCIDGILTGAYAVSCMECQGKWMGSILGVPDEIPLGSRRKLLQYFFGKSKELQARIKEHGGKLTITFWDQGRNRVYEIRGTEIVPVQILLK